MPYGPEIVERIDRARKAILANDPGTATNTGEPFVNDEAVIDLFANLIHLCMASGIDFHAAFEAAIGRFQAELFLPREDARNT